MARIFIGIVIGLVLATFAPKAAEISRSIFDAGINAGSSFLGKASEAVE